MCHFYFRSLYFSHQQHKTLFFTLLAYYCPQPDCPAGRAHLRPCARAVVGVVAGGVAGRVRSPGHPELRHLLLLAALRVAAELLLAAGAAAVPGLDTGSRLRKFVLIHYD